MNIIIVFLQKTLFKYVSLLPTYNALKAMSVNILIWLFLRHFLIELTALSLCRGPPPSLNHTNSNLEERILKNYTDSDYALNKYSEVQIPAHLGSSAITLQITLKRNASSATAELLFHF